MASITDLLGKSIYSNWPAANTQALVTFAAPGSGKAWVLDQINAGFSANPAAAKELIVSVDGTEVFKVPVLLGGPVSIDLKPGILGGSDEVITVTLAADTGGAKGYLNVMAHVDNVF